MALNMSTNEQKLAAMELEINEARKARRDPGSDAHQHYQILKAIAADIRAQLELPRSQTLGAMERALNQLAQTKTDAGYDDGKMNAVAQVVVHKWPFIRLALEKFGEESAE